MSKLSIPVLIIGAGIAGLAVADELIKHRIAHIFVDTSPPGGFASTGNQGWLQSGALYLAKAIPDELTAAYCQRGYHFMRSAYSDFIQHKVRCLFLYNHKEQHDDILARCQDLGIEAASISIRDIESSEPLLRGSSLSYAVRVPDHIFDNTQLLQSIAKHVCERGASFYPVTGIEMIRGKWDGARWHIFLHDDQEIECNSIILACGVYLPEMLEQLLPGQAPGFKRTKNPVLVLRGETPIAESMLITAGEAYGPHIVPFKTAEGEGATVCLPGLDEDIADYRDHELRSDWLKRFAMHLSDFYPGIKTLAAKSTLLAHVYVCQKFNLLEDFAENQYSRRPFCLAYAPEENAPKNVFALYPGKFTSAPLLAQECVEKIEQQLQGLHNDTIRQGTTAPTIAKQRYCDEPLYRVVVENGQLVFRLRS